jgi:hypothetical protein
VPSRLPLSLVYALLFERLNPFVLQGEVVQGCYVTLSVAALQCLANHGSKHLC